MFLCGLFKEVRFDLYDKVFNVFFKLFKDLNFI